MAKQTIKKKKKDGKYCVVWDSELSRQEIGMDKAKEQAIKDISCLDKNIQTVYICKIVKKVKRCIQIQDVK